LLLVRDAFGHIDLCQRVARRWLERRWHGKTPKQAENAAEQVMSLTGLSA
jgi:hypothetical protein